MRLAVIHNPAAGAGPRAFAAVRARLGEAAVHETAGPGDAERLAAKLAGACDRLVVAGGDGTVNEVVNGLARIEAPPPVALVPLGTANTLACEIGLSCRPERVADAVLRGAPRAITLGEVNGRRFVLMAGVGFDAHAVAGVESRLKEILGRGAYAWSVMRRLADFEFPRYRFRADGTAGEAASLIVANARMYGGPHVLAPAGLARPELVLCRFDGGRARLIAVGARLFTVGLGARGLAYAAVTRVEIEGPEGEPVQADGDIIATLPVTVRALPAALRLVYPSASARTT